MCTLKNKFTQQLLVNFTINYKEMESDTKLNMNMLHHFVLFNFF